MAQHDHVGRHRLDVHGGVDERFAFQDARRRDGDVERVGAQALFGDFERGSRPRARLEEEIHDRLAPQRRDFLDRALRDLAHGLGRVEDEMDLVGREIRDAQQIFFHPWISTSSRPSISVRCTWTL